MPRASCSARTPANSTCSMTGSRSPATCRSTARSSGRQKTRCCPRDAPSPTQSCPTGEPVKSAAQLGIATQVGIQNCHPGGAGGHEGSGCQPGGGVQPDGGNGHPGGGLNRRYVVATAAGRRLLRAVMSAPAPVARVPNAVISPPIAVITDAESEPPPGGPPPGEPPPPEPRPRLAITKPTPHSRPIRPKVISNTPAMRRRLGAVTVASIS